MVESTTSTVSRSVSSWSHHETLSFRCWCWTSKTFIEGAKAKMWIHWLKEVCYAALPCQKKLLNQKSVDDINGCTRWNVLLLPRPHLADVLDPGPFDWQSVAVPWMTEKGESFGWKRLHTEGDLCFSRPVQALSTDTIWRLVAAFWRTDSDSRWRIWEGNLEQVLVHGWFGIGVLVNLVVR